MRTFCITTLLFVLMLLSSTGIQAQTTETKPNQVELFKQFIGSWKADMAKDTILIVDCKSYGTGLEYYIKTETKGKIIMEGKAIMGYDKKSDRGIQAEILNDTDITLWVYWFTSPKICEVLHFQYFSNPKMATSKFKFEFKSPDVVVQTFIENNKTIRTFTFYRRKQ